MNLLKNLKKTKIPPTTLKALSFVVAAVCVLAPEAAMATAATTTPWDGAASSVLGIFTGGLTRTLAILSVIACGVAAIMGKLSWDWAIKIVVGIVLIFGSATIVDYIVTATTA